MSQDQTQEKRKLERRRWVGEGERTHSGDLQKVLVSEGSYQLNTDKKLCKAGERTTG